MRSQCPVSSHPELRSECEEQDNQIVYVRLRRPIGHTPWMWRGRQPTDPGPATRITGVETEFQGAIVSAHLLVIPVVIAVIHLGEIGVPLHKASFLLTDTPIDIRSCNLLQHTGLVATKPGQKLEAHAGARNPEAVI